MLRLNLCLALPALVLALAACGTHAESVSESPSDAPSSSLPAESPDAAAVAETAEAAASEAVTEAATEAVPAAAPVAKRPVGTAPGELVPAFTAKGTAGDAASAIDSQSPGVVTIYCAGSTTCPFTNKYAKRMQEVEAAFAAQDVQFVWLYPNRTEADDEKSKWHADKGLKGTFVIDRDAEIAKVLNMQRTPEMVVTAADGTITYRGAIDDGKGDPSAAKVMWLSDAITATLAGRPVAVENTKPAG